MAARPRRDRGAAPRRARAGGDGPGRAQPEGHRPGPRPQARASSAATRSRAAGPCSNCSRSAAARCDGSCWPRTRTPRRSWTASRSWRRGCGCPSRRCRGPASMPRPAPRRPRASSPWPDRSSRCRSRTWPRPSRHGTAPFLLVAAGITDPRNLGALLRSAECAGVTGVVLPRHRSARLSPTVAKTAAGAIEHLAFAVVGGVPTALSELRRARRVVGRAGRGGGRSRSTTCRSARAPWRWWSGARRRGWRRWCAGAAMRWWPSPNTGRCRRSTWAWPGRWPASRSPASAPPRASHD